LTDWNGLIIAALAKAGFVLGNQEYIKAAEKAADFIIKNMLKTNGKLLHRFKDGESAIGGFANDYAFFIWGLIELYQSGYKIKYLSKAIDLNNYFTRNFWDEKGKGYFFINMNEKELINTKEIYDGAIPSSNSVSAMNLMKLGRITNNINFEEMSNQIFYNFSDDIVKYPLGYTYLLSAFDFAVGPSNEIIIIGEKKIEDSKKFINIIKDLYLPSILIINIFDIKQNNSIFNLIPYLKNYKMIDNKTTLYFCEKYQCKKPITNSNLLKDFFKN
jgi:uncharacterized protein YyaL (SSP411 family)